MEDHDQDKLRAVSIKDSLKVGFHFMTHVDKDMLTMLGAFFGVCLVLHYLGVLFPGEALTAEMTNPVPGFWLLLLFALSGMPLFIYVVRKVVLGEAAQNYFGYFMEGTLWRVILAGLLVVLMIVVPAFLVLGVSLLGLGGMWPGGFMEGIATLAKGDIAAVEAFMQSAGLMIGLVTLVVVGVVMYVAVRFAFLNPHTVVVNRIELKRVFNLSKGVMWKIIGTMLLSALPSIFASMLLGILAMFMLMLGVQMAGADPGMMMGGGIMTAFAAAVTQVIVAYFQLFMYASLAHLYKSVMIAKGEAD